MKAIFNALQANKELRDLAGVFGITLRDLMYDQARLLAQDAVRSSPPGGKKVSVSRQKKKGEKDVTSDIKKVFWPTDYEQPMEEWRDRLDERGYEIYTFTKNGRKKLNRKQVLNEAGLKEIRKIHLKYRNAKGKVRFTYDRDRVAAGKYAVPKKTLNQYIKSQIKKVGQLKAGFINAADYFATLNNTTAKAIPSWVRKQAKKMGDKQNNINPRTGIGSATIINNVPYSELAITENLKNRLEYTRQQDINKQAIKRIRKMEKKQNQKYARAA